MKNIYAQIPTFCFLLFSIFFPSNSSFGQNKTYLKIEGYIRDAKTQKPLEGITVTIRQLKRGTTTDKSGYYSLSVTPGYYVIAFTSIAHKLKVREVNPVKNILLDEVELEESAIDLEEVEIKGKNSGENTRSTAMGTVKLNVSALKKIPVVFGETDILRALILQPGVSTVGEGAGGFNVRGGRVDQNLVLLDEMPIFNTSHLLGFFANVNPDVVSEVTLYKGSIPATYGGRLSSLLNITTKNGNSEKWKYAWGIGPVSGRALVEGPIIKDKLTFLAGVRLAYPNWMISKFPERYVRYVQHNYFYDFYGWFNPIRVVGTFIFERKA